LQLKLRELEW